MRYLTLAADYTQSCLRDEFEGPIDPESLGLSAHLCSEVRAWSDAYRPIIPLGEEQRAGVEVAALIGELDRQGLDIASRVQRAIGEAKVRYYSEGLLQYLI